MEDSGGIVAHKYCLYFSELRITNNFKHTIHGFNYDDVAKEIKRGKSVKCHFCGKNGALVKCANSDCTLNYHFTCGIMNNTYNNYHDKEGNFPSYCQQHKPDFTKFNSEICKICLKEIENLEQNDLVFQVPCCNSYYHKKCVRNTIILHDYDYVNCPYCNNLDEFHVKVKSYGLYKIKLNKQCSEMVNMILSIRKNKDI